MSTARLTLRSSLTSALGSAIALCTLQSPASAVAAPVATSLATPLAQSGGQPSAAREWNEVLLESIRNDLARPTIHARNLYHVSIAMWDAWATYDATANTVLFQEDHATTAPNVDQLRSEAICYASYRILSSRFANSPGASVMLPQYDSLMIAQGFDPTNGSTAGDSPSAIGNRIAAAVLAYGDNDNSNERNDYANRFYLPVNDALVVELPGNPTFTDPNRWQPLSLQFFIDQSGNVIAFGYPDFISPEWGIVPGWSLTEPDRTVYQRDGFNYWVFKDPGAPPLIDDALDRYRNGFEMVSVWSAHLDPSDGVMVDVSPAGVGNAPLAAASQADQYYDYFDGGDWGAGYASNPVTGQPYAPQMVPRGDYSRVLAEFWADGPESETPPGHWFVILNDVSDHPSFVKQLGGSGPVLNDLEWCVKTYLAMGGAMQDAAISAWGVKGWYDYPRPVSALRYLAGLGQRSDPQQPSYHPDGINLHPGYVEVVTAATTATGQRHENLAGEEGKIAVLAWRGPEYITDPLVDQAGVGWILAENWWPYQRPSFVTPPFAGYVSGHSTYSRAAAVMMDRLTGSPYFPDGLGEYVCPQDQFLVFEQGPSVDVRLQWASYYDASDQCSLSRIWGGIHPPADDLPGRQMGQEIGEEAHDLAQLFWSGNACDAGNFGATVDLDSNGIVDRCEAIGSTYCAPAVPNSTGVPGAVSILGSVDVATNDFKVSARDLPQGSLGYFLASTTSGVLSPVPGSAGTLCVLGSIGRGVGGGVLSAGTTGTMIGAVDLSAMPQPTGAVTVQAGETWHFQLWHRDVPPLNSNFTDAVAVTFQ
ncbi:vanadium-dependent haloperoxidase [bacterium]|nr:vanadium-dependent haloperoxidase [bacterium]MDB4561887.1 vanadium-dependent haloperoxidase [bacterium]